MEDADDQVLALLELPENLPIALELQSWVPVLHVKDHAPLAAHELLADPQYLETARNVVRLLRRTRERVYWRFWDYVARELKTRLAQRADVSAWEVRRSPKAAEKLSYVSIAPPKGDIGAIAQVCAEDLATDCCVGVFVGEDIVAGAPLKEALRAQKYRANKKWAGWQYFRVLGFPALGGEPDDLLRINEDNHAHARPIASNVTDRMWELFERYAEVIEALNSRSSKRSRRVRNT